MTVTVRRVGKLKWIDVINGTNISVESLDNFKTCAFFFLTLCIYWLCWVFVAVQTFLWLGWVGATLSCGTQASPCGFSCGAQALRCAGFSSCNSWALEHKAHPNDFLNKAKATKAGSSSPYCAVRGGSQSFSYIMHNNASVCDSWILPTPCPAG